MDFNLLLLELAFYTHTCVCKYVCLVLVPLFTKYFWISFLQAQSRTSFPCSFEVRWGHVTYLASEMWTEVVCFTSGWKCWKPVFTSSHSFFVAGVTKEAHDDVSVWLPEWSGKARLLTACVGPVLPTKIHFLLTTTV